MSPQHAELHHATPSAVCGHCEVRSCANPALNTLLLQLPERRRLLSLGLGDILLKARHLYPSHLACTGRVPHSTATEYGDRLDDRSNGQDGGRPCG
jgi:hypothetical protein